jgi:predicted nucleic acid-binding protein
MIAGEFWSVVTHPASPGRPSEPREARAFVDSLVAAGARPLRPTSGTVSRLLANATDQGIAGSRIFDLLIAIIAQDHGAREIWSHDRRFRSLPGLRVVDPLA